MTVEILPVFTTDDVDIVEGLAWIIWHEHFTPIIGEAQVEYMLEKFQNADAMTSQISDGWEYYLAMLDDKPVGYLGLVPEVSDKRMMLSKIYLKREARGMGIGKTILDFTERKCVAEGFSSLWLTVNRFNHGPVEWYQNHGFKIIDQVKKDIGEGYFMDDYVMEKTIIIK